jgi:hypothetical protein
MTDLGTLLSYLADGVVVAGGLVAVYLWASGRFRRHDEAHLAADTGVALLLVDLADRNKDLRIPARTLIGQISQREKRVTPTIEAWEKDAIRGNPLTQAQVLRRQTLTNRLQAGQSVSPTELAELLNLLNVELKEAQDTAAAAVVVIGLVLLIALVIAAIAAASK